MHCCSRKFHSFGSNTYVFWLSNVSLALAVARMNISLPVRENFSRSLRSRSIEDDANALFLRMPSTTPGPTKTVVPTLTPFIGEAIGLVTCRAAPLDKLRKAVVVQMQSAIANALCKLWQL